MSIFVMPQASAYGQNVKPFDGAKLYFYESGTTTPKTSYSDPGETIANTNPIIADDSGLFGSVYISGVYKAVLTDKNDVQIWSEDGLSGFGDSWSSQGNFDSSTNGGDYPSSGQNGYVYRVTEAFVLNATSGGYKVNVGDFIKANKNGATGINADWDIIRGVVQTINTIALTDGANISTDCSKGTSFTVTLAGNRTLDNPTNKLPGQQYTWIITQDATGSRTLGFGTNFVFDGASKIKAGSGEVTVIKGIVVSSTVIRCQFVRDIAVKFESDNLKIDVATNTTVTATADRISLLSDSGDYVTVDDISETFDITTDLIAGTSEKSSVDYWLWTSAERTNGAITLLMVPDLVDTTDGTTANKLVDSGADFVTDDVSIGDIVYNTTDLAQTTVTAIDDLNTLSLADDIFVSGEDYRIRLLSPTGLGTYKARIGCAENNGSSNLDDSFYTQIQERKRYTESGGDFAASGALYSASESVIKVGQVNDWTGVGYWNIDFWSTGSLGVVNSTLALAISGITFKSTQVQNGIVSCGTGVNPEQAITTAGASNLTGWVSGGTSDIFRFYINADLETKPTFHT